VDLGQPRPALLIQRSGLDLVQQLADHAADPHHLGRLLHHLDHGPLAVIALATLDGHAVRADDDNVARLGLLVRLLAHSPSLSPSRVWARRGWSGPGPARVSGRSGPPGEPPGTGEGGGARGLLLAGVRAIPTVTGGLDSGIRCPTLGERRSSGVVGHVILL